MLQIPKPPFWICMYLFLTVLFLPKYDKRDDFDLDVVNFPFFNVDVPRFTSGVYISQLIRFARVCSHVTDLMLVNKV